MDVQGSRDRRYAFGDCQLDLGRGALLKAGVEVKLRPKSFKVLEYLVTHAGQLVGKQELLDAVWGKRAVTEDSITQCIVEIRRAIGAPDAGRLLRTVPRRGFLLDMQVCAADSAPVVAPAQPGRGRPGIGGLWTARHVAAAILLLAASLAPMRTAWDGQPKLQRMAAPAPVRTTDAEEAFLLGRHLFHRRAKGDLAAAERHLQRAVALDPGHAGAWAALAGVYAARGQEEPSDTGYRLAEQRRALEHALRLGPDRAEPYVRLARLLRRAGDPEGAAEALRSAFAVAPDDPLVLYERSSDAFAQGRLDEAIQLQRQAVATNPLSAIYRANLGQSLLAAGRYDEGLAELRRAQLLAPTAELQGPIVRGLVASGRLADARQALRSVPWGALRDQLTVLVTEDGSEAQAARARLESQASAYVILLLAEIAAFAGDRKLAFTLLDSAIARAGQEGRSSSIEIKHSAWSSPFLQRLRPDPRWPWHGAARVAGGAGPPHTLRRY